MESVFRYHLQLRTSRDVAAATCLDHLFYAHRFSITTAQERSLPSLSGKYFPLADEPTPEDLAVLKVEDSVGVRAVATGEFRSPRKGEWFLSDSYIEAYRADNDLTAPYNIAKLAYV